MKCTQSIFFGNTKTDYKYHVQNESSEFFSVIRYKDMNDLLCFKYSSFRISVTWGHNFNFCVFSSYSILCTFNLHETLQTNEAALSDQGSTKLDQEQQMSYKYLNTHINRKTAQRARKLLCIIYSCFSENYIKK